MRANELLFLTQVFMIMNTVYGDNSQPTQRKRPAAVIHYGKVNVNGKEIPDASYYLEGEGMYKCPGSISLGVGMGDKPEEPYASKSQKSKKAESAEKMKMFNDQEAKQHQHKKLNNNAPTVAPRGKGNH